MKLTCGFTWGCVVSIPEHLGWGGGVLFSSFQTTTDLILFFKKKMKSSIIDMQYGISFGSCS